MWTDFVIVVGAILSMSFDGIEHWCFGSVMQIALRLKIDGLGKLQECHLTLERFAAPQTRAHTDLPPPHIP